MNQNRNHNSPAIFSLRYLGQAIACGVVGVAFVLLFWFGPGLLR